MGKGRFTARPKEQYLMYGETYASNSRMENWHQFGRNQENDPNVANRFNVPQQPAIQAPSYSGPIIEEVNSDDEVDAVEKLSTTMDNTSIGGHQSEQTEGETYTILDLDSLPRCSTVQRGKGSRDFGRDFFDGDPDVSAILREGSVFSQVSTSGNRGVIHFDEVPSSGSGSKRGNPNFKEVTFVTPVQNHSRRYTPPLESKNQRTSNLKRNKSNSVGNIHAQGISPTNVNRYNSEEELLPDDINYPSDEDDDDYSDASDVEVVDSDDDSSNMDDSVLESVREGVRRYHKNAIEKNIKFVDKLRIGKNQQGTDRFSSKSAFQIPRAPFYRLVREVFQDITKGDYRIQKDVIEVLRTVSEEYIIDCFKMANVVTAARQKATLYPRDMRAARKIISIGSS